MGETSSDDDESVFEDAQPAATGQQKKRLRKSQPTRCRHKGKRQGGETWVQRQQEVELLSMLDPAAKADESPACAAQRLLTLAERPVCLPCRDVEKQARSFTVVTVHLSILLVKVGPNANTLGVCCLYVLFVFVHPVTCLQGLMCQLAFVFYLMRSRVYPTSACGHASPF